MPRFTMYWKNFASLEENSWLWQYKFQFGKGAQRQRKWSLPQNRTATASIPDRERIHLTSVSPIGGIGSIHSRDMSRMWSELNTGQWVQNNVQDSATIKTTSLLLAIVYGASNANYTYLNEPTKQ